MSAQTIIQTLEKLVHIHQDVLAISQQKTEIIKEGSVEKLQALLVKERRYIRLMEQAESARKTAADDWLAQSQLTQEDATITNLLEMMHNEDDKQALEKITVILTEMIIKLKQQEQLNQQLINQSMQFVQLSLDVMTPSIKSMNYGSKKETQAIKRSVFDSKA